MRVANPPAKPLLIFDGECNFCRRWIARWQQATGDRVDYAPASDVSFPEIPAQMFAASVVLIEPDGAVYSGAEAVFRVRGKQRLYEQIPGLAPVSEWCYRQVAHHRQFFSWLTRLGWGDSVERPTYARTRWLFLRAVGVIYCIAFVSLWTQIAGLIGSHGIMPAQQLMDALREQSYSHNGIAAYWLAPTLCWFSASDTMLQVLCGGGVVLSLLVIAGFGTTPALALLWMFYLSLSVVGDVFLGYQWDALLLETGCLAFFFALGKGEPSRAMLWLLRLLLFKLMFFSGVVKLVSGDALWRNLTALTVHYETQPLPTWIGWWSHQLPVGFQKFSCAVMFAIELGAPWLIFLPRRPRVAGGMAIVFLQVLIILTGNYTFFNLLTIALCIPLLDDRMLRASHPPGVQSNRWRGWLTIPLAVCLTFMTVMQTLRVCQLHLRFRPTTGTYVLLHQSLYPFRCVNTYGLFAMMTPNRPEIILEGSADGIEWKAYEFNYKPGDVTRCPRFVAPHQPRLDWQMWFEALRGPNDPSPWFLNFCARLLQGQPAVLQLLQTNPFPDAPPRYVRVSIYDYRFTDWATHRADGTWWRRELVGRLPAFSLPQ